MLASQLSSIEGELSEARETATNWDARVRRLEEHEWLFGAHEVARNQRVVVDVIGAPSTRLIHF